MGILVEYCQPDLVEGIFTVWFLWLQWGFHGGKWEWGIENVGKVEGYIYICASCLQLGVLAQGIPQGHHEAYILRVGGDWESISSFWREAWGFTLGGILDISVRFLPSLWNSILVPMRLWWSDIQPIWPNIHSLILFFYVSGFVWPCILLLRLRCQGLVVDSFLHRLRFLYRVVGEWRGRLCEFSRTLVDSTSKSLVQGLLQFRKVLLVWVPSSCGNLSSSIWCLTIPFVPFWIE